MQVTTPIPVMVPLPMISDVRGESRSKTYQAIREGLLPPPIKRGLRNFLPDYEIAAITKAEIAGASHEQLRNLVRRIVADRARLADLLAA